ncbi:unnamed protein product [Oncorhynchus mykiss]|uniref:MRN complex-interacting protein N-terminal domain-containing protein n=1 Tax=Oncorhynchus mykiss TaxID=8022 RepID=A0A060X290_ONCMY|nr:unnamed protein product [Oncorhynchus mykiss]
MVQECNVRRCCLCQIYQVQQVTKAGKLCGEKQSVIKEFGRSSGVDCRRHVQKLNARRRENALLLYNCWREICQMTWTHVTCMCQCLP